MLTTAARSPTSASSERSVSQAPNGKPWEEGGGEGKYQYHPGGDTSTRKDAPSALNVVIIPNVTLPKVRDLTITERVPLTLAGTPRCLQQVGQGRLLDNLHY